MRWSDHWGKSGDGRKPADSGKIRRRHGHAAAYTEAVSVLPHRSAICAHFLENAETLSCNDRKNVV